MKIPTYRIEFSRSEHANVWGEASETLVATLWAVTTNPLVNRLQGFREDTYSQVESAEVDFNGNRTKAEAHAVRMLRIHAMLKRDHRRETQAAFMAACEEPYPYTEGPARFESRERF